MKTRSFFAQAVCLLIVTSCTFDPLTDDHLLVTGPGQLMQALPKGGGGVNGQSDYCTGGDLCTTGEGDCDFHAQCDTGLCAADVGEAYGMGVAADVCVPTGYGCESDPCGAVECGATHCACDLTGGGYGTPGDGSYCTTACKCDDGYGDCDYNSQCQSGLCAQDVGAAYGFNPDLDICVPTGFDCDPDPCGAPECGAGCSCDPTGGGDGVPGSASYCTALCPCVSGYGDCDVNAQCQSGLCAQNVGAAYGLPATTDVCVPTGYGCDTAPCAAPECGATGCSCDPVGGGSGTPNTTGYCSSYCPCADGYGDCNQNADCQSGLCAQDVGAAFGLPATADVCVPTGYSCDTDPCGAPECGATHCACDPAGGGFGTPGDGAYCTEFCPCESGFGDCDRAADCVSGLCAQDVGAAYGFAPQVDICVPTGFDCDTDPCGAPECGASCSCDPVGGGDGAPGGASYCTVFCPCANTYGDCDTNAHCQSGLCAHDVGPAYGLSVVADVCVATGYSCDTDPCGAPECGATDCGCDPTGGGSGTPYTAGYCNPYCPCNDGYGDCNQNVDCQSGLCAQNVGTPYGWAPLLDLCVPSGLGCDTNPCADLGCGATSCCGNGATDPGEECDDGNNDNGDGCSATCQSEHLVSVELDGVSGHLTTATDSAALTLGTGDFTIEMHVRFDSFDGYQYLIGHDIVGDMAKWILGYGPSWPSPDSYNFFFHINDVGQGMGWWLFDTPAELAVDVCYHVAVVRSGTELRLFLDGALLATDSFSGAIPDSTGPITLGSAENGGFIDGSISTTRMSNSARYWDIFVPSRPYVSDGNTIALWPLDEGAGSSAHDSGPHGLDLTLASGAGWVPDDCGAPGSGGLGSEQNPGDSCLDILTEVPGSSDGIYWIDPTGSAPFQAYCDMTTDGGGWTLMTPAYLDTLALSPRRYLYSCQGQCTGALPLSPASNNSWYRTPITTDVWDWNAYTLLQGDYTYGLDSPTTTGTFSCNPGAVVESGTYGFGCVLTAGGGGSKVVPFSPVIGFDRDEANAEIGICQDDPGIFGTWVNAPNNACVAHTRVLVREDSVHHSSCLDVLSNHPGSPDGSYWIDPTGSAPFQTYCDMTTDGGGWTLVAAAMGGQRPSTAWGGTTGIDESNAPGGNTTFRFSDSRITEVRQTASLMRVTKSHGITAFGVPPSTFDSTITQPPGPTQPEVGPVQVCDDVAMTTGCQPTYSDMNTGPWGTDIDWPESKTSVISGNNVCADNFGITNHPCDFDNWDNGALWLKLWLR